MSATSPIPSSASASPSHAPLRAGCRAAPSAIDTSLRGADAANNVLTHVSGVTRERPACSSSLRASRRSPSPSKTAVLQLEFRNGLAYEYFVVPAVLYGDLLSAQSKGPFVARFIRAVSVSPA